MPSVLISVLRIGILVTILIVAIVLTVLSDRFYDFQAFERTAFINPKFWFTVQSPLDRKDNSTHQRVEGGFKNFFKNSPIVKEEDYCSLGNNGIVSIRTKQIPNLNKLVKRLNEQKVHIKPFVLVCVDADEGPSTFKKDTEELLECPFVKKIFSQNNDIEHPKITAIPIGVDYHTIFFGDLYAYVWDSSIWLTKKKPIAQELELYEIAKRLPPPERRATIAYTSAHLNISDSKEKAFHPFVGNRQKLKDQMDLFKGVIVFETQKVKRKQTWVRHGKYLFIISPPGVGIDCHRTWEALILGNIVIALRTPPLSDQLFEKLPVVLIDDISEITLENLNIWRQDYFSKVSSGYYDFRRLTNAYWLDLVKKSQQ